MVDAIMKNSSNKNMMSVIDDMLNEASVLERFFSITVCLKRYLLPAAGSFSKSINSMLRISRWRITESTLPTK